MSRGFAVSGGACCEVKALRFKNLYSPDSITTSVGVSGATTVISRLIGLGRGVALAWLIPQAQFGLFGIALLIINVLLPLCSAGLYEGVARYAPLHEAAGGLRTFIIRSSLLVIGLALAATAILSLCAEPIGVALFSTAKLASTPDALPVDAALLAPLMRASLFCVLGLAAYHTLLGLLKGLRMFRAHSAAELVTACLFTLLALLGALGGLGTARALVVAYALSCVAGVLIFAPGLIVAAGPRVLARAEIGKETATQSRNATLPIDSGRGSTSGLLAYSLWAAGTAVLWHALSYYPMWYLLKVSDGRTVGTFHAVRMVAQFVQIGAVVLTAVVAANVNRLWEHDGRDAVVPRLALLTKACLVILIAGATILSLARPVVMRLFPSTFADGEAAYDPLVLFFLLVGVVGLVAVRLNLVEKPRLVCLAWLGGVVVNVAASYALLGPFADSGPAARSVLSSAAWANVAGAATALMVCVVLVRRERLALDVPTGVLITAAFSVGLGWPVAVVVLILLITAACTTGLLFSPSERASLRVSLGIGTA